MLTPLTFLVLVTTQISGKTDPNHQSRAKIWDLFLAPAQIDNWKHRKHIYIARSSSQLGKQISNDLCLSIQEKGNVSFTNPQMPEMFAQKMCQDLKYQTAKRYFYKQVDPVKKFNILNQTFSKVNCDQNEDFTISCDLENLRPLGQDETCSVLLVECGSCEHNIDMFYERWRNRTHFSLQSPLYPRLQPGSVCQWEFDSSGRSRTDYIVNVTDLDFGVPGTHSPTLTFYAGDKLNSLEKVVQFSSKQQETTYFRINNKGFIRVIFRSSGAGSMNFKDNLRGFSLNITTEDNTWIEHYKTNATVIGGMFAIPIGLVLLCCIGGHIYDKCSDFREWRRSRNSGPSMMPVHIQDSSPDAASHGERSGPEEEPTLVSNESEGDRNGMKSEMYETLSLKSLNEKDLERSLEKGKSFSTSFLPQSHFENAASSVGGEQDTTLFSLDLKSTCKRLRNQDILA